MSSHMFLALLVLKICILSSRKFPSESFPYEISKSGSNITNLCFQNWFLSTSFEISHDPLDQSNSLRRAI